MNHTQKYPRTIGKIVDERLEDTALAIDEIQRLKEEATLYYEAGDEIHDIAVPALRLAFNFGALDEKEDGLSPAPVYQTETDGWRIVPLHGLSASGTISREIGRRRGELYGDGAWRYVPTVNEPYKFEAWLPVKDIKSLARRSEADAEAVELVPDEICVLATIHMPLAVPEDGNRDEIAISCAGLGFNLAVGAHRLPHADSNPTGSRSTTSVG